MKNQIIRLLKEKQDYVSGQEICAQLGVSRTAVWKNVNALKSLGYEIDSVNNRGYKLISEPDALCEEAIAGYLETEWLGRELIYQEEIDSTNAKAKRIGEQEGKNGTVVVADCQTAGRGRRGKSWISPKGMNIYFSILLRPDLLANRASMITLVAAMALADAVKKEMQLQVQIKWPNDVIVNGKKISGILTESSTDMEYVNYVVVGIGVNCNQEQFEDEIKDVASSIILESGEKVNRNQLLATFLQSFEHYYSDFLKTEDLSVLIDEYNSMLVNCGRQVRIIEMDKERILKAIGIDKNGALIVENENGKKETIVSGEVSVRGVYGYV